MSICVLHMVWSGVLDLCGIRVSHIVFVEHTRVAATYPPQWFYIVVCFKMCQEAPLAFLQMVVCVVSARTPYSIDR